MVHGRSWCDCALLGIMMGVSMFSGVRTELTYLGSLQARCHCCPYGSWRPNFTHGMAGQLWLYIFQIRINFSIVQYYIWMSWCIFLLHSLQKNVAALMHSSFEIYTTSWVKARETRHSTPSTVIFPLPETGVVTVCLEICSLSNTWIHCNWSESLDNTTELACIHLLFLLLLASSSPFSSNSFPLGKLYSPRPFGSLVMPDADEAWWWKNEEWGTAIHAKWLHSP